ncbi:MAG: prolipoprotein diacylglyceryl transferase [Coriobacteriia bacterium]|nr:prolipoprotein diacylglyceryl transferase [Coriobacteriia bacterium]
MLPVLVSVGPLRVYSYGILLALAFAACWAVARTHLRRAGLSGTLAVDLILAAAAGGLIGARVLYVVTQWQAFAEHPLWVFQLQRGGMVFYGGLIGGTVAVCVLTLYRRLPFPVIADVAALAVPLGSAIGRVGCFMNGCCAGGPTGAWYGVLFPGGATSVVPVQLLDSGANLAMFAVLTYVAVRRKPRAGTLWWAFLTAYPAWRFAIEFVRVNPPVLWGLSQAQFISIPLFVAGVVGLVVWSRRRPAPDPSLSASHEGEAA